MEFPREVLESLISNTRLDHKGENLYGICPYCGVDEFGISLRDNHLFRCFRGKQCGETGNIFKLLKYLGKMELLGDSDFYKETDIFSGLEKKELHNTTTTQIEELPNIDPPVGWKRISCSKYLESRGFTKEQFEKYEVGTTRILRKFKGYVIFLVRQGGCIKGYVSRNTKDKKEIQAHNEKVKEYNRGKPKDERQPILLRYSNSLDTDFSKILFGVDEIVEGVTQTVIIVEGLFDKINLEIIAPELFKDTQIVVCCTWGKKISKEQILLMVAKGIHTGILLYDPDAISDSKRYGFELQNYLQEVKVGFLLDKDPGDLNEQELIQVLENLQDPPNFSMDKLQKREF